MIPLAATCMGLPFHPALYLPLSAFALFLRLFPIGDILVPMFFGPFNLFPDSQFVPPHSLFIHHLFTERLCLCCNFCGDSAGRHQRGHLAKNWTRMGTNEIYYLIEAVTFPIVWPDLSNASKADVTFYSLRWSLTGR